MHIEGQVVLVSGGASGLGEATVRFFAAAGANVAILDVNEDQGHCVAADVGGYCGICDITDSDKVAKTISDVVSHFSQPPRIIVNCAGVGWAARIVGRDGELSLSMFRQVMEINLFGTYNVMSYAAKALIDSPALENGERGVIINTSSAAYEDGQIGQTAYAASKGAISSLCLPAAREFARHGIRVMTVAPGLFRTPMMEGLPENTVAGISRVIPFPSRLGIPDEYARLIGDIVKNPYLNGSIIRLDGAVRLPPK